MSTATTTPQPRWLPTKEFVALSEVPLRTLRRRIKAKEIIYRKRGKVLEISAAALPASAQIKLAAPSAPCEETQPVPKPPVAAANLFPAMDAHGPRRRIALSTEAERQALERLAVLQPLLDFTGSKERRGRFAALRLRDGRTVANSNDMAQYLSEVHQGVSAPTLWRWKRAYEQEGLAGLARKVRQDKGRARWAEQFPDAAQLVRTVFWQPYQTMQQAYDVLLRDHKQVGMARTEVPSYGAVCQYLNSLPQAPTVLAREGERAHHDRMSGHLTRGYTDLAANDCWVSDTMLHDVLVWNDCFDGRDGAAVRVQLVAIMDMRSRKIVGARWMLNGSSRGITSAFVGAARRFGLPRAFYCDNGKDYKKVAKCARPLNSERLVSEDVAAIETSGALRVLGIPVTFCRPFSPWSKPIERVFRTLHGKCDALHRHYTTGNAYLKPDATVAASEVHGKLIKLGRVEESPLMPASHFVRIVQDWIEMDYNAGHKHSGRGMDGRTPNEVYAATLPAEGPRWADEEVLATLLWGRKRLMVRRSEVLLNNRPMVGATAEDAAALYLRNGEEVTVCFDEHAPDVACVADADGRKLCTLRAKEFAPQGAAAAPMIAASAQLHRTLRNASAEIIRTGRRNVARAGHQSPAESLHQRALAGLGYEGPDAIVQPAELRATGTYGPASAPQFHSEDIGEALADRLNKERSTTHGS